MNPQYFDLSEPNEIDRALRDLRGYWKLWSTCLLSKLGLPNLRGAILISPYPEMENDLLSFMQKVGSTTTLVRHDKHPESPPHPRGGFLVGKSLLLDVVHYFFQLNRIVAVYEQADPLLNMHNVNFLFENKREIYVEIVGPGFDASDLQRGDLSPHEAFSVTCLSDGEISDLKMISRVSQNDYLESVRARKEKITRKLESSPTYGLAQKIRHELEIADDVDAHLKKINSPLCHSQSYQPISETVISGTITNIVKSGIIEKYVALTGAKFPLNFSTSIINGGKRQVFWDIVSPTLKYEGLV